MEVYGNRFRKKRFELFLSVLDRVPAGRAPVRVLDVGGVVKYWEALRPLWADRALEITVVNVDGETGDIGNFRLRHGNACDLSEYADNSFDIVHSNSVIEHVGGWRRMAEMAAEIRRLAPHYYVQTPNFWFPVEPHFRTAFYQWYPESTRASMLLRKKRGFRSAASFDEAMHQVQDVNLLTATQMASLFPDAELKRERVALFTKSLIAVR